MSRPRNINIFQWNWECFFLRHAELNQGDHHLSSSPDCRSTAEVTSLTRRTALSDAILSRIDEVLKCGDSTLDLHMIFEIPMSCLHMQLSVCVTVPRILTNFFPSHMKSLFCTDKIDSTEWQDHIPRQHTGNCLLIHTTHWGLCDQPLSSHRTSLHDVELRQCVFCKEPLLFWFWCRRRNSVELCADACSSVSFRFSLKSFYQEDLPADVSNPSCRSSFYFDFEFLGMAPVSCLLVRHFALILNLKQVAPVPRLLFPPLFSTSPVIAMLKTTNCFLEWQAIRNSLFRRWWFSRLSSIVAFDCWPTHKSMCVLRKACLAIGVQAFHRVIARLRTDWDHERTLVPPRGFALLRLQSTLRQGFWTFFTVSISLEFNSFLLIMCIDAHESTTNSRFCGFVAVGAGIPCSIGEQNIVLSEFLSM